MSRAAVRLLLVGLIVGLSMYLVGCGGSPNAVSSSQNNPASAALTPASSSGSSTPSSPASSPTTPATTTSGSTATTSGASGAASVLPTPPANASVFSNLQSVALTGSCNASSCAGGSGNSSYFAALNQTTPSLSGASMEISSAGAGANALFWWHNSTDAALVNSISHLLEDFWIYTDNTDGVQAFEYDPDWYVNGYKYDMSIQCDYADGKIWRLWDSAGNRWVAVSPALPCGWTVNTWHHVQLYVTSSLANHTYTYQTLVIDGNPTVLNATYSALSNGWGPTIGTEAQLDGNSSGTAIHEWIDNMTLTVW